jgi:hypothetical protein
MLSMQRLVRSTIHARDAPRLHSWDDLPTLWLCVDWPCRIAVEFAATLAPLPRGAPAYQSSPGSGCRGIQPHPLLSDIIYLISELDGSLAVLRLPVDGSGRLSEIQSGVKTYPPTAPVSTRQRAPLDTVACDMSHPRVSRFLPCEAQYQLLA